MKVKGQSSASKKFPHMYIYVGENNSRWLTSAVGSLRIWRAQVKVNILLTKMWHTAPDPPTPTHAGLLDYCATPLPPTLKKCFVTTFSHAFICHHYCHRLQTRWCKFAKSIIQKSTNWRGTSGTWRGGLRSGYWRYLARDLYGLKVQIKSQSWDPLFQDWGVEGGRKSKKNLGVS